MDIRKLRHLLAVAEEGSVNRAAARLNLSQPSLTYSIRALERMVGAELLLRGGSGVRPTRIGEAFLLHARAIVREAEKAGDRMAQMGGGPRGRVVIGVLSPLANATLAAVLHAFATDPAQPHVELRVFTLPPDQIVAGMARVTWDLVLTLASDPIPYAGEFRIERIATTRSLVHAAADHPLVRRRDLQLADLSACDWVVSSLGATEALLTTLLVQEPRVRMRSDSMRFLVSLVAGSRALCLAPGLLVADDVARGHIVALDVGGLPAIAADIVALTSRHAGPAPGVASFVAAYGKAVRSG